MMNQQTITTQIIQPNNNQQQRYKIKTITGRSRVAETMWAGVLTRKQQAKTTPKPTKNKPEYSCETAQKRNTRTSKTIQTGKTNEKKEAYTPTYSQKHNNEEPKH